MEFRHRSRTGGLQAALVLFLVFPALIVGGLARDYVGMLSLAPIAIVVCVSAALYVAILTEVRVVIGPDAVRVLERDGWFGSGPEKLRWELPLAELTSVREVTTKVPSSRGGWNTGVALHFPGDRVLRAEELGLKGYRSEYDRLAAHLRERLGERFTTEEKV